MVWGQVLSWWLYRMGGSQSASLTAGRREGSQEGQEQQRAVRRV